MKKFRNKSQNLDSDYDRERLTQDKPAGQPAPDDLSVSLRADMLPASNIRPDMRKFRRFRLNPLTLWAILLLLILPCLGWFLYFGPARPVLDEALTGLLLKIQPDNLSTPTPILEMQVTQAVTEAPVIASTMTPTARVLPSSTATRALNTPTNEPTVTASDVCVDVLTITLEDVGKSLCMRGVILNFEERPSGFLMAFSAEKGSMYWVSYDLVWKPAKEGLCVETTGEVMQIANTPVLVFGYQNLPQICSTP